VPGQGTTLRVNLPLASARLEELDQTPMRASRREVDGLRILVVEDDATVAEVIIGLLDSLGHRRCMPRRDWPH